MSTVSPETTSAIAVVEYKANEAITSWMSTAASQIFFMQLGFLCYEVGFVKPIWAPSVILKNIEDTFVGILTYLAFTHTLSMSTPSLGGIISVPKNILLYGIEASSHEEVFIASVFATTCATIISGGVLERMKNKAYILWCFLIILINYSFIQHWVWNPDGWLAKMGFMDGAGSVVVHSTGGISALIAIWRLGPRRGCVTKNGKLLPVESASRPIINALGCFILWYGWFAFNLSSPIAAGAHIGDAVGTIGLVTCLGPTCASCSALLMMYMGLADLSYDNLLGALLGGLVSITGSCYTIDLWAASIVGFFTSPVYFISQYIVRDKWRLDDPLQILPIHLFCGIYSCIMEGIFGNNTVGHPGLIYSGYTHFGVQLLGTFICVLFNVVMCLFLWLVVMEKCLFRKTSISVSVLDTYLGTKMFDLNNSMALKEVLAARNGLAKQMLWQFHNYTLDRFNNEQFDFLVAVTVFRDLMHTEQHDKSKTNTNIAKAIIKIINSYVLAESVMCVNVSGTQRAQFLKIKNQLQYELNNKFLDNTGNNNEVTEIIDVPTPTITHLKPRLQPSLSSILRSSSSILNLDIINEKIFDIAYEEVFKIVIPVFTRFLQQFNKKKDCVPYQVKLPYKLQTSNWILLWSEQLEREGHGTKVTKHLSEVAFTNVASTQKATFLKQIDTQIRINDQLSPAESPKMVNHKSAPAYVIHKPFSSASNAINLKDLQIDSKSDGYTKKKNNHSNDGGGDIVVVINQTDYTE